MKKQELINKYVESQRNIHLYEGLKNSFKRVFSKMTQKEFKGKGNELKISDFKLFIELN